MENAKTSLRRTFRQAAPRHAKRDFLHSPSSRSGKSRILKVIAAILILFLGFIAFRMITMEADVQLITIWDTPDGVSLNSVGSALSNSQWAAAVDGRVVASGADTKVQPTASTTKMILALAVMEKKPFEKVPITSTSDFSEINYHSASISAEILVNALEIKIDNNTYKVELNVPDFSRKPNLIQRFLHVFGWEAK